jgi:Ca2+-binding RTX toxin-like protein
VPINRTGTQGQDRFTASSQAEAFDGLGNYDVVSYTGSTRDLTINLTRASANAGDARGDTFVSIEGFRLGLGNDRFTGGAADDHVYGMQGNNNLNGGGGDDILVGHVGIDTLTGGTGNDELWGGGGNDRLIGSNGDDALRAGKGDDRLEGGAGADTMIGGAGNDVLIGSSGGDSLAGGQGADQINVGSATDGTRDFVRYSSVLDFGDTITGFRANGTYDVIQLGGALRTALDDASVNGALSWGQGNRAAGSVAVTVGSAAGNAEALYLSGVGGEGVVSADVANAAAVAAAFNAELDIAATDGQDALIVVNDTDANKFSVWLWTQANGGEIDAAELQLIGVVTSNTTVTTSSFAFF